MYPRGTLLLASLALLISSLSFAQQNQVPMTNATVRQLVQAGVADETIALAIQHSKTNFDTSAEALIGLKRDGVSSTTSLGRHAEGGFRTSCRGRRDWHSLCNLR